MKFVNESVSIPYCQSAMSVFGLAPANVGQFGDAVLYIKF